MEFFFKDYFNDITYLSELIPAVPSGLIRTNNLLTLRVRKLRAH
jgi:hypothetical protein